MEQKELPIQMELFQYTKSLNLSEKYETIPKSVSPRDPLIKWVNKYVAESVEKPFILNGEPFTSEISPANFKDKKGVFKSHFPHLR